MIADDVQERRAKLAVAEKLQRARDVKVGRTSMSDNATDIEPKRDTRAEVAKETKLRERKLRAAARCTHLWDRRSSLLR
jgi:hypothetical protein